LIASLLLSLRQKHKRIQVGGYKKTQGSTREHGENKRIQGNTKVYRGIYRKIQEKI